jgi:hypothetical protein
VDDGSARRFLFDHLLHTLHVVRARRVDGGTAVQAKFRQQPEVLGLGTLVQGEDELRAVGVNGSRRDKVRDEVAPSSRDEARQEVRRLYAGAEGAGDRAASTRVWPVCAAAGEI